METGAERVGLHFFYWQEGQFKAHPFFIYTASRRDVLLTTRFTNLSKHSIMKNTLLVLGLIGSATAAFGQSSEKPNQKIMQKGNGNVVKVEMTGLEGDTLAPQSRTILQNGNNLVHIESNMPGDSLNKVLENVAVEQKGKNNVVSVQGTGGKNNSVNVVQSGSGNSVSIKQN